MTPTTGSIQREGLTAGDDIPGEDDVDPDQRLTAEAENDDPAADFANAADRSRTARALTPARA